MMVKMKIRAKLFESSEVTSLPVGKRGESKRNRVPRGGGEASSRFQPRSEQLDEEPLSPVLLLSLMHVRKHEWAKMPPKPPSVELHRELEAACIGLGLYTEEKIVD
ncbi:uncharacterized protein MELLADRAFT_68048 [Melampsora larici-populina 98AG31]|uniref:Uncharacterized protein n=1 Tax=Melampsora larici-populina (strain 98AG31 / pathotype 3-4-7) TaxID=747676 RepID=F4S5D8_MELLP|nr:uncharacterized protein MELLADRAFT_68048 [Melampsora larici-populina 98AG31]EGG00178.1 hypothetical protein MELLADRAFT_68048 [Melampsora larici-populina 98AG31]